MGVVIKFPSNTPKTVASVYDGMSETKRNKLHFAIGSCLELLDILDDDETAVAKFLITHSLEAKKETP